MAAAAIARRRGWLALVTTSNQVRQISKLAKSNVNGKRTFLVDTLGLARRLEAQGVPPNQAKAITSAITKVINDSLEDVLQSVVTNGRMRMSEIVQDNLSKFKSEVLSSQARRLEAQGVPPNPAEAITSVITEVLNDSLVLQSFVTNGRMEMSKMVRDANLSKFKSELQSLQAGRLEAQGVPPNQAEAITSAITEVINDSLENVSQSVVTNGRMHMEHHFSLLRRETEKLKVDIEKMRSELRCEIDQVTAGLCLDLNIERGRLCEEISKQSFVPSNLTNKLDREILSFKVQLVADKYDAIKHCVGFLISISAVGVVALKIFM